MALGIGYVTRRARIRTDTAIGVLFAGMFALGVALFSAIPNFVGDLLGFLFGDVLGISFGDLAALSLLATIVVSIVALFWKELLYATFDPLAAAASGLNVAAFEYLFLVLVALTIVVSLQAVGIILVVAMLLGLVPAAFLVLVAISPEICCPERLAHRLSPQQIHTCQ